MHVYHSFFWGLGVMHEPSLAAGLLLIYLQLSIAIKIPGTELLLPLKTLVFFHNNFISQGSVIGD